MKDSKAKTFSVTLRVPFHHLDPMHVVWHGNYFQYFEAARDGLFNSADIDFLAFYSQTGLLFPVIRISAKYIRPLRYKDEFVCTARIVEAKRKIVVDYEIRLLPDNILCTTGQSEQVAMKMPDLEIEFEIPQKIRKALEV